MKKLFKKGESKFKRDLFREIMSNNTILMKMDGM